MRFAGKVCIITGGGSGIGRATCLQLAREGGRVLVVDYKPEGGEATTSDIAAAGGDAAFARADIAHQEQVEAAVNAALVRWKQVDVLVNDAAMMVFSPLVDLDPRDWDHVMAVNLRAPFLFAKFCLPHMRHGAIVNVSSVHAYETTANVAPYAASKGGIEALARALSREVKPDHARVNCVAPGAVDTPMLRGNPNVRSGKETIAGAVGRPEDIAQAICWVASDDARFMHGATLVVDGGRLDIL
jgi:NAD(P)-dependent dehydrogenase (short-subunit alcohol dehydrogenase family)